MLVPVPVPVPVLVLVLLLVSRPGSDVHHWFRLVSHLLPPPGRGRGGLGSYSRRSGLPHNTGGTLPACVCVWAVCVGCDPMTAAIRHGRNDLAACVALGDPSISPLNGQWDVGVTLIGT